MPVGEALCPQNGFIVSMLEGEIAGNRANALLASSWGNVEMVVSDLIYDVGMHKGEDTDFYLKKGFRVIAFEANPDLVTECKLRFSKEISAGRLTIVEGAIVGPNVSKPVKFYKNIEKSVWGTVVDDWLERNDKQGTSSVVIEVSPIDFALCLKQYGIPHYMKVDIEGMDLICFETLRDFPVRPNFVSLESEKVTFSKLVDEITILSELGYTGYKAVQQSDISSQKEPVDTAEGNCVNYTFEYGSSGLFGRDLPNEWVDPEEIIRQYKQIFLMYKYFGDYSFIRKVPLSNYTLQRLGDLIGRPLPGWYDTHAVHKDFVKKLHERLHGQDAAFRRRSVADV
jgi:FkbM family methyltransferase